MVMTALEAYEDCRRRYIEANMQMHNSDDAYKSWREQKPIFQKELSAHVDALLHLQHTGDAEVMNALGDAFQFGYGIEKNLEEAIDHFRVASQAGHTRAMVRLGRILERGNDLKQHEEALSWFHRAAEGGYAGGMVALGFVYRDGQGASVDPYKAAEWFAKAVEAGDKGAKFLLAKVYYFSLDATDMALPLLLDVAERENTDSFKVLGQIYGDDRTTYYDFEKALYWYERVVKGKYTGSANAARIALAKLYLSGKRQPKNVTKAKECLNEVALNSPESSRFRTEAQKILDKINNGKV